MVVASLALFLAIGGVTYAIAVPFNSVGTKQLKKNAVTSAKIKNAAVTGAKITNGAVTGVKVGADSLTGAQILESSLGKVPSSQNADNAANAAHAVNADSATSATNATKAAKVDSLQTIGSFKKITATDGGSQTAARAAAPEVPLFQFGALSVYAKCFNDTSGPTTYAEAYIRTTIDGSVYNTSLGVTAALFGQNTQTYLNTNSPEAHPTLGDRRLFSATVAANNTYSNNGGVRFTAAAPDGSALQGVMTAYVKNGNPANGNGIFGAGNVCIVTGFTTG
jgi:hypothetical protein